MTTLPAYLDRCAHLDPVSLPDLQASAAFLTRRDRKYLVPAAAVPDLLAGIDPAVRVLEIGGQRSFGYDSTYFDDAAFTAYHRALRRRPNRFKVRTRRYLESGLCLLEVKLRDGRGRTVKHRMSHESLDCDRLTAGERQWLASFPAVAPAAGMLLPCLTTRYKRVTLALPNGAGRVTIDRDLLFLDTDGAGTALPGLVIIETKGAGSVTPVDRLLWRHGHRPVSISKFACGLGMLLPGLPANRWYRLRSRLIPFVVPARETPELAAVGNPDLTITAALVAHPSGH